MNRILFERGEIRDGRATFSDVRAEHVLNVLHGEVGQTLKTGVLNGPVGTSVIERIEGNAVTVRCTHETPSLAPWIDLILAPPRPRAMKRLATSWKYGCDKRGRPAGSRAGRGAGRGVDG